jgi:ABC-2 type transport system permease protein
MTALLNYGRLVGFEVKCFRRNPPAAVLNFALPVVVVLILSATLADRKQILLPAGMTFGLLMACYSQIAFTVVSRRDNLWLKRLRSTPLRLSAYLCVMLTYALLLAVALCAIVYAVGVGIGGADTPHHWAAFVVTLLVGAFSFCSLGLAISALVPNEDAAPAFVWAVALPMVFLGTFFTINSTSVLGRIASVVPTRHLDLALAHAENARSGLGFTGTDLLVLAAWGIASLIIAAWRFRWEPK